MSAPPPLPVMAQRIKKSEMAGVGCFVQGLGIVGFLACATYGGPIGIVVGIVLGLALFIAGSQMSVKYLCGNCKNPIASKQVTVCPACHATLQ